MDVSSALNKRRNFVLALGVASCLSAVYSVSPLVAQASERVATLRVNAIDISSIALQSGFGGHNTAADKEISTLIIGGKYFANGAYALSLYRSVRIELGEGAYYSEPVQLANSGSCFANTMVVSPDGRWLAAADGSMSDASVYIADLSSSNLNCSDETKLLSYPNEDQSVLRFNANSTRLWIGVPYATWQGGDWRAGPTQGFTTEFGLGFSGEWSTTRPKAGYLFGEQQAPNFNAGYGAALAFSADTNVRAVLADANRAPPSGYERNPDTPTILLQRDGASDVLFRYTDPESMRLRIGTRLTMDAAGSTVVHATTIDSPVPNERFVELHTFSWISGAWERRIQSSITAFDCFGDLPNATRFRDPHAADAVLSDDGRRLAVSIYSSDNNENRAFGLCLFTRDGIGAWELLAEDSQTATNALRSAIGGRFSGSSSAELGKLQANDTLGRLLFPHKDFAAVIELEWSEVIDQTGLPIWLLYEASKS